MNKIVSILFMICLSVSLNSCGMGNDGSEVRDNNLPYVKGETLLVSHKDIITEIDTWMQTQYIGDTLYYCISGNQEMNNPAARRVYARTNDGEVSLKLDNEKIRLWSFSVDKDHNLYFITHEKTEQGNEYHLIKQSDDGQEAYCKSVSDMADVIQKEGILDGAVSDEGYCVLTINGTCIIWNLQGELIGQQAVSWIPKSADYYEAGDYGLVNGKEDVYVYHVEGEKIFLQNVEFEKGRLGSEFTIEMPKSYEGSHIAESSEGLPSQIHLYSGHDNGLYVTDDKKLYTYDESNREVSEVIGWQDTGINVSEEYIREITVNDQGIPTFYGYDEAKCEGILYSMDVKRIEEFQQKTIQLGYIYDHMTDRLNTYVEDFNASQGEITVALKKYEDLTALHLDLIQGKGPDLLHLYEMDINEYVEKDILENLDPYFKNSNSFRIEEILPSMRQAMSRNGSVYYVFPYFTIDAIILKDGYAKNGVVTTDEFLTLTSEEGYLCNKSVSILANMLVTGDLSQYVDWENRRCSFNDGRFAEFLKIMKSADLPEGGQDPYKDMNQSDQFYENKYMALFTNINTIFDYREIQEIFSECGELVGYPNQEGEEWYPIQTAGLVIGINSASENKEDAWAFLDHYVHEAANKQLREMQRSGRTSHFSVLEDAFEKQLDPQPIPGMEYKNYNQYTGEMYIAEFEFMDEEKEAMRDIANKAVWSDLYLTGMIGSIISEESAYYFNGDKSAEEVADIIQSRVSLYMAE